MPPLLTQARGRVREGLLTTCILGAALLSLIFTGCGEPERQSAAPWDGGGGVGMGGQPNVLSVGSCSENEEDARPCKVYHQKASGVTSCFNGIQYCDAGRWSDCLDPGNEPQVP